MWAGAHTTSWRAAGWRPMRYTDYAIPRRHMKTCVRLCRDLCEIRAEAKETFDDLKLKTETDCVYVRYDMRPKKRLTI